jgi:lactose/L-arabinose transport system permease protein
VIVGAARREAVGGRRRLPRLSPRTAPYLFLLPALALFAAFKIYPFAFALLLSLYSQQGDESRFIGLASYVRLLHDPLFFTALGNNLFILVVQVPLMLTLALLLALALNAGLVRLRVVWRLAVFLPVVTGLVAYGILFSVILNHQFGLLNAMLEAVALPRLNWLGDPALAKVSIMIAITWHYTGSNAVIYLAGLQGIPRELYEAAEVDGAGRWHQFLAVTMPMLRPILLLTIVLSSIGTLQLFEEPYVLTGGGPSNATMTMTLYLYQNGFRYFDFGYASTIAYVMAVLISTLGILQLKILERRS